MKLNWFSPLPPAKTDIAHYTKRLLPSLARIADITLWTDQKQWDRDLEQYARIQTFRAERISWSALNRADMTFYQIGNNPQFHGAIWQISRLHAGVIVLHDLRLHHFFDGIFRVKFRDRKGYLAVMEKYYGEEGRRDAAHCYRINARNIDEMALRYPLTELALENALGVIVHTTDSFQQLSPGARWPLAYLPLAFPYREGPPRQKNASLPYRLIVFGYIGRSRRLDSILQALSQLPEKDQFVLDIFGELLDGGAQLQKQIRALGLKGRVVAHGFVNEAKLDEELSRADLALNLRYPTMGEASGSQLRIWAHGLPSLVSNVGWYASLPDETVARVDVGAREISDIQRYLREFAASPDKFALMGLKGRELLRREHGADSYAAATVRIAEQTGLLRGRAQWINFAERLSVRLGQWFPEPASEQIRERVAAQMFELT